MKKEIEQIQEDVRTLRDSDTHHCPADDDDNQECTCEDYDIVIDKLQKLIVIYT